MPVYKYKAKKGPHQILEGSIEAVSENEAVDKISLSGLLPVSLKIETQAVKSETSPSKKPSGRIKSRQITLFSQQLASLLKSGVPILNSLNIIAEESEDRFFKEALRYIHDLVQDGASLSNALSNFPNVFSSLYIAMVRSGENSSALPEVLLRIADYRTKDEEISSRIRLAMAYPVLMAVVGVSTVIFMLTFVMPRLVGIFANLGHSLPLPTRILILISEFLQQWWLGILLVLLTIVLIIRRILNTAAGKLSLSMLKLHLPVFGKFLLKAEFSRFFRTLELLIKNGIPILKALDIAIPVVNNEILRKRLKESYKELEQGGSFGATLKKDTKLFPLFMSNLIIIGEESGRFEEAMAEAAAVCERERDEAIKVLSSLLEPLMILAMGLIVGFMVLAMLLPVFQINIMAR